MTAGERLIAEGEQRGLQQGEQQGLQQGKQQGILQGKRDLLLEVVRQRFASKVDADAEQRIAAASLEQLDAWIKRLLTATTVGEMLAD